MLVVYYYVTDPSLSGVFQNRFENYTAQRSHTTHTINDINGSPTLSMSVCFDQTRLVLHNLCFIISFALETQIVLLINIKSLYNDLLLIVFNKVQLFQYLGEKTFRFHVFVMLLMFCLIGILFRLYAPFYFHKHPKTTIFTSYLCFCHQKSILIKTTLFHLVIFFNAVQWCCLRTKTTPLHRGRVMGYD